MLTVDTPFFGRRLTEIRNGFRLPPHLRMANFDASLGVKTGSELRTDEMQRRASGKPVANATGAPANKLGELPLRQANTEAEQRERERWLTFADASLTWEDLKYLKSITRLPIWLKGIMTEEDALLAIEHGADAIYVSNHGGRQLDCAPPTLRVLEGICRVVGKRIPVVSEFSPKE